MAGRTATERLEQLADDLGLTGKQRQFGLILAAEPTKSRAAAAREAGYNPAHARMRGCENVTKSSIKVFMDAAKAEIGRNRRNPIADAAEILAFHSQVMRGNMADFLTKDEQTGRVKVDPSKVSRRKARLIKEITVKPDGEIKLKLQDAQHSADRLARHLGLYSDDDGARQLQAALTLGAVVATMPDADRSELARRLMGPSVHVVDVTPDAAPATEVVQSSDVSPEDSDR